MSLRHSFDTRRPAVTFVLELYGVTQNYAFHSGHSMTLTYRRPNFPDAVYRSRSSPHLDETTCKRKLVAHGPFDGPFLSPI
jgi:hypothetical protein